MMGLTKKLLGGAVGVLSVAVDFARHAGWYVRYRVDGTTHEDDSPPTPPARDA